MKKLKRKIILMEILSFVLTILPLIITVVCRLDVYVKTPGDAVKLSVGGIIVLVLLFFKAIGKLKMPAKRVVLYLFFLCLCYFLQAILNDAMLLLAMATLGEVLDIIICQHLLRKWKEDLLLEKGATKTTAKVKEMLDNYVGGGRS